MERSFSSVTATEPPPMIEPLRAMQVSVAPLPSWMTVPTGMATGAPAVVDAEAGLQSSADDAASVVPLGAMQGSVAPLPSWMTVPPVMATGAPAVVDAEAAFQPSAHDEA